MPAIDPQRRSLHASIAALTRVGQVGGTAVSAPARAARLQKYLDKANPDGVLTAEEATKRAQALLRADMKRLADKSAQARRRAQTVASA
jgi:hypothetical protein